MKIKNYLFLLLLAIFISSFSYTVSADTTWYYTKLIAFTDEGGGTGTGPRDNEAGSIELVEAFYEQGSHIDAFFVPEKGVVSITLKNSAGTTVYTKAVSTNFVSSLKIDVAALASGTYTIYFVNENGVRLLGSKFNK